MLFPMLEKRVCQLNASLRFKTLLFLLRRCSHTCMFHPIVDTVKLTMLRILSLSVDVVINTVDISKNDKTQAINKCRTLLKCTK